MDYDAFTGGINPGGLRTKNEIRVLICYLLASVDAPLSKDNLVEIMQNNGLANYFEITDAIAEMAEKNIIHLEGDAPPFCTITQTGRMISSQLETTLPPAVRDKAVQSAISLMASVKRETENKVEIEKKEKGYKVICHISGGPADLMNFSIYVPDLKQAKMVRENFYKSPETIYRVLLALLTGNLDLVRDVLRSFR